MEGQVHSAKIRKAARDLLTLDKNPRCHRKKAHMEILLNGGSIADKDNFTVSISKRSKNEMINVIGITKGKGFKGKFLWKRNEIINFLDCLKSLEFSR